MEAIINFLTKHFLLPGHSTLNGYHCKCKCDFSKLSLYNFEAQLTQIFVSLLLLVFILYVMKFISLVLEHFF